MEIICTHRPQSLTPAETQALALLDAGFEDTRVLPVLSRVEAKK